MCLVTRVGNGAGIRARRIHERHDGHGQVTVATYDAGSLRMVLGTPHAVIDRAVLRDEADAPVARIELQLDLGGVQRAVADLDDDLALELPDDIAGARARRQLGGLEDRADVVVYGKPLQLLRFCLAEIGLQQRLDRRADAGRAIARKRGIITRGVLGLAVHLVRQPLGSLVQVGRIRWAGPCLIQRHCNS